MEKFSVSKFAFSCFTLLLLIFSSLINANQPAINWLETQYAADGSYGLMSEIGTSFQSASEIISAYHLISNPKNFLPSIQYLDGDSYESCEYLSRKIIARINGGQNAADLTAKLTALQNADGGFGEMAGYDSTSIDTALALNALAVANLQNSAVISNAIAYLVQQQQADGGYPLKLPNASAVYNTALVTIALQKYGYTYALDSTISRANLFITNQRIPGGSWQSNWETAIALQAIATVTPDLTNYVQAIAQFRASQLANGSWDNDIYVTALSLKADYILSQRQLPIADNAGGITGKIIDALSGAPLQGVSVRLDSETTPASISAADGLFSLAAVAPGQHTLSLEYAGYVTASRSVSIQVGVWTDLGVVQLSPLTDRGVLSGTIRDVSTGAPVAGATISLSGSTTLSAVSNASGFYQLVLNPGSLNVSVTATGYETVTGSGVVAAGSVINFSPAMYATGSAPVSQTVTVKGLAVDADSGTFLSGTHIAINNVHVLDAATGGFQIDNIVAGMIVIDITHEGYLPIRYTVLAPQGSVLDLGLVRLQKDNTALSTVTGHVVDDIYNTPIAGAEIRVLSMPGAVVTDVNGDFIIENISGTSFSVTANAAGYYSSTSSVTMASPGIANIAFRMQRTIASGFDILDIHTHQQQFEAMTEVEVDAVLSNTNTTVRNVLLFVKVINSSNVVVDKSLSKSLPLWVTPEQAMVSVQPGVPLESEIAWDSARHEPGIYTLVIQAYDLQSNMLLAERATQIEILSTRKIGGLGEFDPPLAQLAAKKSVGLKAGINNRGNLAIDATTITARVRLKNKGYDTSNVQSEISVVASNNGLSSPRGMAMDSAGNIYVVNPAGTVSKIAPDGTVSQFAGNLLQPIDLDIDSAGNFYILLSNSSYVRITAAGQRTTITTGLIYQQGIKVLGDGRILIALLTDLYEFSPDGTSRRIISRGLASAQGAAINSTGQVFIANRTDNNIVRFSNGVLSTFISGITQPYGIAIDEQDNIFVTSFSDNSLLRITPDKQISTIATGLSGPYDVKISAAGNYIVSNTTSNEIVSITPQGVRTVLAGPTIFSPIAASYDVAGSLYVGNQSTSTIVKFDAAMNATPFATAPGVSVIRSASNGGVNVLANAGLHHIAVNQTSTLITAKQYTAFDNSPDGTVYAGVYQGNLEYFNSAGVTNIVNSSQLLSPQSMRVASNGSFYILTNNSVLKTDIAGNYSVLARVAGASFAGLAVATNGDVYVTQRITREILKIDTTGNVTVVMTTVFTPGAIAINAQDEIYVAQLAGRDVYRVSNAVATLFTTYPFNIDDDMYVDASNNLWVSHTSASRVSKRDNAGVFTSYTVSYPRNITQITGGNILVGAVHGVSQIDGAGNVTTILSGAPLTGFNVHGVGQAADGRILVYTQNSMLHRYTTSRSLDVSFVSLIAPTDLMYALDGGLFLINYNGYLVKISQQGRLPQLLLTGQYSKIRRESATSALLTYASSISRLNLVTNVVTPVTSGYYSIGAFAVNPSGGFVVGDLQRNELTLYNAQDVQINRFVGLSSPKGLLFNHAGELLVSNDRPDGLVKIGADGKLRLFSTDAGKTEYMAQLSNGNILVSGSSSVREIHPTTGLQLNRTLLTGLSSGIAITPDNQAWIVGGSDVYQFSNNIATKVASGLSYMQAVDVDSQNNIYVADISTGTVNRINTDGSLQLVLADLPQANKLAVGDDDTVYVSYNQNHLASYSVLAGRKDYDVSPVIEHNIGGLVFGDKTLYASVSNTNAIYKLFSTRPVIDPIVGDLVYSATRPFPAIPIADMKVDIDFGGWTPENSGDYEIDVSLDDGITSGHLTNTLHVGPLAKGEISLAAQTVVPGDNVVTGYLNIQGADSTSITTIDPSGLTYAVSSGVGGAYAISADSHGNVYMAGQSSIIRITPAGVVSTFVDGLAVGAGMAADSSNNLYAVARSTKNILKITPNGQVSVYATLPTATRAVAVATDYNDVVYAIDTSKLYRLSADGSSTVVRNIEGGAGLTIDAFGNFYIVKAGDIFAATSILRVSPDGSQASVYLSGVTFEFEGVNVTADCSNNLLFAPWQLAPHKPAGSEEDTIIQLIGDTGVTRQVLYGPPIDNALSDMDILYYDRLGKRLIIWTDMSLGKTYSFPVVCGGIDLEAHIITRPDVDLSSTDPAPTSVIDRADGNREFVWLLSQVDNSGRNIQLNMLFKGLNEDETRRAFSEAFLIFNNTFDPANPVKVALDIPSLTASAAVDIQATLDAAQYPANTDVNITVTVNNRSDVTFNGELELEIKDASGSPVASLPTISVTNLPGSGAVVYSAQWNTGISYAGNYVLHATQHSTSGFKVANAEVNFAIVSTAAGNTVLTSNVSTDKAEYQAWDVVNIEGRIRNDASNVIQLPTSAVLTVTAPGNVLLFSETINIRELYPQSYQNLAQRFNLVDTQAGPYTITLNVTDAATGLQLTSSSVQFAVTKTSMQALKGTVTATPKQLNAGGTAVCDSTISNISVTDMDQLTIIEQLADMATGAVISEQRSTVNIMASSGVNSLQSLNTAGMAAGEYACLLSVELNGATQQLAAAGFRINQSVVNVNLATQLDLSGKGRLLILLDAALPPYDIDPDGPTGAPSLTSQRAFLEFYLQASGWSYTLATNTQEFMFALRHGGYSGYVMLSEENKLTESEQFELREAVYSGAGLLMASGYALPEYVVNDTLGVKIYSPWINVDRLNLLSSPLQVVGEQVLAYKEKIELVLLQDANVAAVYPYCININYVNVSCYDDGKLADTAVTWHDYGQGRSVYVGIDLLAQVTSLGAGSLLDDLLLHALQHITPEPASILPGQVIPLHVQVSNTGIATSGRLAVQLSSNASIADAGAGNLQSTTAANMEFDLPVQGQDEYRFWIKLPYSNAAVNVSVATQTGSAPIWTTYSTTEMVVTPATVLDLDAIATQLALIQNDEDYLGYAYAYLNIARSDMQAGNVSNAVYNLMTSISCLEISSDIRAAEFRLKIDQVLNKYTQQLP